MPLYDYKCNLCGCQKEIFHPIKDIDNPSISTVKKITCCNTMMQRIITNAPALSNWRNMSSNDKKKVLTEKTKEHYEKEVKEVKNEKWKTAFGKDYV